MYAKGQEEFHLTPCGQEYLRDLEGKNLGGGSWRGTSAVSVAVSLLLWMPGGKPWCPAQASLPGIHIGLQLKPQGIQFLWSPQGHPIPIHTTKTKMVYFFLPREKDLESDTVKTLIHRN